MQKQPARKRTVRCSRAAEELRVVSVGARASAAPTGHANAHVLALARVLVLVRARSSSQECTPGFVEVGAQALSGPTCVPSVGGSAGLKAAEAMPSAALSGGVALPSGILYAPASPGAPPSPRSGVPSPTDGGESSDTANTGAQARHR